MSALLGKAGKKLFERHLEQYAPADPLYEFYTDAKGKQKRRKRAAPPGLSARDAKILKSVQRRAHYLDKGFSFCGLRFGWTFLIGLIPVVGDVSDVFLNYLLVVRKARQADIPPWLLQRMLLNNAVSAGVGFIPLVGDVMLAMYKANSRNAALFEEFLRIRGEEYLRMREEGTVPSAADHGGKKKRKGVSEKDAQQVKPGAGIANGETVPVQPVVATSGSVSEKSSGTYSGGWDVLHLGT
ncbi:putative protein with domain of unknown function (DUF4112) [Lyophyllum shimeji]|uniref:Uncharacterized protein n=1 Tax=Lyophyllum shimeji TaxID=47721 RepID=A0A9P3Q125_LYOSH|nr:putative protein with domain of unknown function (DUF4112) [Lyophyllum shimeji]